MTDKLTPVFIDFETYWAAGHSLSNMTPIEYVLHPDTEIQSVGIKVADGPTEVLFGEEAIRAHLSDMDWSDKLAVGHNMAGFDALILAWVFDVRPAQWACTLAMSRPLYAKAVGGSLKALAEHFGLTRKGSLDVVGTKGKRLVDFTSAERVAMAAYNKIDVDICADLYRLLRAQTSDDDMRLIDITVRMLVDPQFELDIPLLRNTLGLEQQRKQDMLVELAKKLGVEPDEAKKTLASQAKFRKLLVGFGVDLPMKPSTTNPDKLIPALAKTDEGLQGLLKHPNELVALAAGVRLDVKSTLLETRLQRFLDVGELCGGMMPIALQYAGADTTSRWSGTAKLNCFGGDTEVLTPEGWVRFDCWRGEPIMQWWPDGRLSFEANPGYLAKPHSGPVVTIAAPFVSGVFTPEHRFVSCPRTKSGIKERTAQWVASHTGLDSIPVGGLWEGAANSVFTPDEARVMVALAADGHVVNNRIVVGLRKARKIKRLQALFEAASVTYSVREYPPQATHKGEHSTVSFSVCDSRFTKGLGPWVLKLSQAALEAAADEVVYWDGWRHANGGQPNFCSASKEQALWVATLWHLTGRAARVACYAQNNPAHKDRWVLHQRASKYTSVVTKQHVTVDTFDGRVYCASVASSYILVRHNDNIFVCGQCQNLPRVNPKKPKLSDALRKSLRAPDGYKVVVVDLSGIELRVNHFLWQEPSTMRAFQEDPQADLYKLYAATRYNIPVESVTKDQRQFAKLLQLSLGYGAGYKKFQSIAHTQGLALSEAEASNAVSSWRDYYRRIVNGWRKCGHALSDVEAGRIQHIDPWGLCLTSPEGIQLPRGFIRYPGLRFDPLGSESGFVYNGRRGMVKLFSAKVDENIVQTLAGHILKDKILQFADTKLGRKYPLAHTVHDEVVYVVRDKHAQAVLDCLLDIFKAPVSWWPDLITFAEGDIGQSYGDAK